MSQGEHFAALQEQRKSAAVELELLRGGLKIVVGGVDRTATHVAALKTIVGRYDQLLRRSET